MVLQKLNFNYNIIKSFHNSRSFFFIEQTKRMKWKQQIRANPLKILKAQKDASYYRLRWCPSLHNIGLYSELPMHFNWKNIFVRHHCNAINKEIPKTALRQLRTVGTIKRSWSHRKLKKKPLLHSHRASGKRHFSGISKSRKIKNMP
jgi:hypothetical protein